jgi:hypothetical protein
MLVNETLARSDLGVGSQSFEYVATGLESGKTYRAEVQL